MFGFFFHFKIRFSPNPSTKIILQNENTEIPKLPYSFIQMCAQYLPLYGYHLVILSVIYVVLVILRFNWLACLIHLYKSLLMHCS